MIKELLLKYKKTAAGLAVTGAVAAGLVIDPELALIGAEVFDFLEQLMRGIAAAGAEVVVEALAE